MLLEKNFEISGQFLFRWRGYLPLFFLVLVFATIYFDSNYFSIQNNYWALICLLVGCIGIIIRIIAVSFVPYGNSGRGTDKPYADSLNTTGMYSVMRNPVYFGNFFTFLAPVLYAQNFWLVALYIPVFALYHERIIYAEERFLVGKFGDEYRNWANNTPTFFPDFSKWINPDRRFCWKTAYRRESISFFTLVATIFGLEIICDYIFYKELIVSFEWAALFVISAIFFLVNCILVKFTKILNV